MKPMNVSAVAAELGVSDRRVRQMLANGQLRGSRVGRAWLVERDVVDDAVRQELPAGRRWRPEAAWALLDLMAGRERELSPVDRVRIRRRAEMGLAANLGRLRVRAEERRFYGHPSVLGALVDSRAVVRSGVTAAGDYDIGLVAMDAFEGYVRASGVDGVAQEFALEEGSGRWNVLLRVVDDRVWPFSPADRVAPRPVVAVDLLDSPDERARRAGSELLAQP